MNDSVTVVAIVAVVVVVSLGKAAAAVVVVVAVDAVDAVVAVVAVDAVALSSFLSKMLNTNNGPSFSGRQLICDSVTIRVKKTPSTTKCCQKFFKSAPNNVSNLGFLFFMKHSTQTILCVSWN